MGIKLTPDEIDEMLTSTLTGIVTTLRGDGMPVPLPVWFAYLDRRVYFRTPGHTKKVKRLARDPRCSFLAEGGERWSELRAVMITGAVELVDASDQLTWSRFEAAMNAKYAGLQTPREAMPSATRNHYAADLPRLYRIVPEKDEPVTWDNAKIRLATV